MIFSELNGKKILIYGFGREGQVTLEILRHHCPESQLTVLDQQPLSESVIQELPSSVNVVLGDVADVVIDEFDWVIKSPGISLYSPSMLELAASPIVLTSATNLYLQQQSHATRIGITGTKGKSTTASIVAHLLQCSDINTALAGNIGIPLLHLIDEETPDVVIIELSSFQCADLNVGLDLAVVLNVFPEHLDWHGSFQRYKDDKLRLLKLTAKVGGSCLAGKEIDGLSRIEGLRYFNDKESLYVENSVIYQAGKELLRLEDSPLWGLHNMHNICSALSICSHLGLQAIDLIESVKSFSGLEHRLKKVHSDDGRVWIDDSISTTPQSSIAALSSFPGRDLGIIVGGFDRGLDWTCFRDYIVRYPPNWVITIPDSGDSIAQFLNASIAVNVLIQQVNSLESAIFLAKKLAVPGSYVILSPGAPSFPVYKDFKQRGEHFLQLVKKGA